jgi:hypothetical protein
MFAVRKQANELTCDCASFTSLKICEHCVAVAVAGAPSVAEKCDEFIQAWQVLSLAGRSLRAAVVVAGRNIQQARA